jgi:small-conductance mechanosensitive channel
MSVYVRCGVAYDSDLEGVEAAAISVARDVLKRVEGADPKWEPVVRWKEFGDSSIQFVTVLRVKEFSAQFLLQSDFIKALHRRFREENIEIPFPIRTLQIKGAPAQEANQRDYHREENGLDAAVRLLSSQSLDAGAGKEGKNENGRRRDPQPR